MAAGMIQVPFGSYGQTVSRIAPAGPVQAYRTFTALTPIATHHRPATCQEADCDQYLSGWRTEVDLGTELGQRQAHFITHDRSRRWSVEKLGERLVIFTFPPGQKCYREHRVPNGRPPRLLVRDGDFRGNPTGFRREHKRVEFWVEDQQESLDSIRTVLERG